LALWIIQLASQSTLRSSAARIGKSSCVGIARASLPIVPAPVRGIHAVR
jgi:hypothetical protein